MKPIRFLLVVCVLFAAMVSGAQEFVGPGWYRSSEQEVGSQSREMEQPQRSFLQAPASIINPSLSFGDTAEIAEAITPEIQALARGLEYDPERIFDYVRDNIRYVHYFGSKKGAQLTLLERSGNDFDQCSLLVSLLRAAGHSARYRFGTVYIPYEHENQKDLRNWLELTLPNTNWVETSSFIAGLNSTRGYPAFSGTLPGDNNGLILHRVWVRLDWAGSVVSLDPAFKVRSPIQGIDLTNAMQFSLTSLSEAAGGNGTLSYIQNLNEPALRQKLTDYTANFLSYVQSNHPNATVEQVLGGRLKKRASGQLFGEELPFLPYPFNTNCPPLDWDYIPVDLMATLQISIAGSSSTSLRVPELQGRKLSLCFSSTGMGALYLEDLSLLQTQTSGGKVDVALYIDHPHGTWDWNSNSLINSSRNDQLADAQYQGANASYVISYAFEPSSYWLKDRQEALDRYRQQGFQDSSRQVITESLNVMSLSYLCQTERVESLLGAMQQILPQHHHRFGRVAQETGGGYYIDMYEQLSGIYQAGGISLPDKQRCDRVFDLSCYFGSAAEHAIVEQLQSSNLLAASTVKMLQVANTNGQRIYYAKESNWPYVVTNLSNYNIRALETNFILNGYTLLLPANGSNSLAGANSWAGYGIVASRTSTNQQRIIKEQGMLISGGYHGGYVSSQDAIIDAPFVAQFGVNQPDYFNPESALIGAPSGADPVSMADGAFKLDSQDLSLGYEEPRGISLSRHYSSSRRYHNSAAMSHGWLHNYFVKAEQVSAPMAGLGDTTPSQMASMIVALTCAFETYNPAGTPKNWTMTALTAKWGFDQLIKNAVSVTMGKDTLQFVKQPGGAYTAPAKSTHSLLLTNGAYMMRERHGRLFRFSQTGMLTNILDQYAQALNLSYDASNRVSEVTDWKGRTLNFVYGGVPERLYSTWVTGRTNYYGYVTNSGQLNLISALDPGGVRTTFVYDTNHLIIATKDTSSRVIVSNLYDNFGRVIEQYSHGDTNQTWKLYWAGTENVEVDPAGGRKLYEFDDKYRLTAFVDALGHRTDYLFDGQDHLVQTISPLRNTNLFIYDGRHNLVATVNPLGQTDQFVFDALDNMVRHVDPRGNPSHFGYNSKYQPTGTTNAEGDWTVFTYSPIAGSLLTREDVGGITTYAYDSWAFVSKITFPGNLGWEGFSHNARGDVLTHTNGRGFVTSFQYNNRREITNTVAPTNLTTRVAFDPDGNVLSTTDARGFTTSNAWSATRKLLATTLPATPQGIPVITNVYDSRDWLSRTIDPLQQVTRYTNDPAQRLISITDPLLRTTHFVHDDDNRATFATNAANEVTRQIWNNGSQLLQTTDGGNRVIKRAYDAAGNQVLLTNRNGKLWEFQFDAANRLTNTTSPLQRQTKQVYNNRGLLQTVIEPSTDTANFYYDPRGRLTNRTDTIGTISYLHDANNNLTNVVEAGRTNSWTFDAYDRVSSYRDSEGNLIQYRMDGNGNVTNLIYPGGKTVTYFFDSLNRLTNVTDWADRKTSIEYDLASKLRRITRPNGTIREINYDSAGQMTNIVEKTATGNVIKLFKLNWNAAARIEWEFAAPLPHPFTPPSRSMTFDDDNRILTFNGQSVVHDLDGNMTTGPLTNNTLVSYAFDARNRLLSAGGLSYCYDPAGNRIAITNAAELTRLVVNPNAALSQVLMRVKNGVTTYYVYGPGLLYEVTENSGGIETGTAAYHFDYRGSTVAITDGAGAVTDRIEYAAYGCVTYRSGTTDTPFLFNGRYGVQTDANGLLYMRARFYNPYLCRFINPDPAGFSGGLNFYAYADGNPASLLDPFGLGAVGEGTGSSWLNTAWNVTKGVGMTVGGFVPWLGDAIEGYTLVAPESSTLDRTLSGASLTLNAWTAGALPNLVPIKRGLNMIGDAFSGATKTGGELMVHPFSGGGTHITTSTRLAAHAESATLGGPSGLFLAPTRQVDALLASGASRSQMEIALGLNEGALSGGTLMRIDVANPFARGLSLPTSGNMFFRPGTGLTWGGLNEGIITSPLKTDPGVLLRPIP